MAGDALKVVNTGFYLTPLLGNGVGKGITPLTVASHGRDVFPNGVLDRRGSSHGDLLHGAEHPLGDLPHIPFWASLVWTTSVQGVYAFCEPWGNTS